MHVYPLYLGHVELAHIKNSITLDRNEIRAWDLHHCAALIEAVKSLALSNVKGHGKVPYQKPRLKSMAHGVHPPTYSAIYILALCTVPTQRERGIVYCTRGYIKWST